MKKITWLLLISALFFNSLIHAGGMGDQSFNNAAFIALEGGYSVTSIDNYSFRLIGLNDALTSIKKSQHYTGILSAGMIFMMDDQFGMTSELGWGYYGRTILNPAFLGVGDLTIRHTLTGFDALLGLAFIQPSYSISLKGGALIQNMQVKTTANFNGVFFPGVINDGFITRENHTAALPEVKLGASYNFDTNWSITGAFLFALGSTPKTTGTFNFNTFAPNLTLNNQNPSVASLLLGIQYTC